MTDREGRIIMFSMLIGAAAGGLFILYSRMKAVDAQPPTLVKVKPSVDWVDVMNIGGAAIGLARRIAALVDNPDLKPTK